jgi:hypothetical protein
MSRSVCSYAAALLAPLAASLTFLALAPRVEDGPCLPAPVVVPALAPLPPADCDDLPAPPVLEPAPAPPRDVGAAVLVHERHLLLATLPDMTWAAESPRVRGHADGLTVDFDPARDVVPAELQAQAGARFTVYAADGAACVAEAGPLGIHGRMDGVFLFDEAPPTRDELEETAAALQPESHVVRAALRGRGCAGVWARRADLPAPIVFGRRKPDARERAEVRRLLDAQPAVAALRAERAEYYADLPPEDAAGWTAFVRDTLELAAWQEVGGARRYVTAQIGSDAEGCDGFGERAAVLFLRDGDVLVAQPGPGFLDPLALMDVDGDGRLEAVADRGRALESRAEASPLAFRHEFPELGCGC